MNTKILIWFFAIFLLGSFVSAGTLLNNLQSYHNLDNNNLVSKTALFNLTNYGSTNCSGKINSGRCFVAASKQHLIYDGSTAMIAGNWTFNAWVNGSDSANDKWIFGKWINPNYECMLMVNQADDKLNFQSNGGLVLSTSTFNFNSWNMVTVTFDDTNNNKTLYVNGVYNNSAIQGKSDLSAPVWLGGNGDFNVSHWNGNIDEVGTWTRLITQAEITLLYNGGAGLSYEAFAPLAPVINNATYNFTSASTGQNSTAWRNGNEATPIKTLDTTPTITFSTVSDAYCRINKANQNWTTMGVNRNCTTTGNSAHVCTLAAADALTVGGGYQPIYIGCIDSTLVNETSTSTSGALNVSMGFTPNVSGLQILPSPSYITSTLNCSFTVNDTDSVLVNVTFNWNNGAYTQSFNNIGNNTFLNSTWAPASVPGTVIACNVTLNDSESTGNYNTSTIISNSAPSGFSITSPTENQQVFANYTLIQWLCSDIDNNTNLTAYWYVNGTLNGTTVNQTAYNLSGLLYDNYYEINATCGDNAINTSFIQRHFWTNSTTICSMIITGISDNARYRNNIISIGISCLGGLPLSACYATINDYADELIICNSTNLTLEIGRNKVNLSAVSNSNYTSSNSYVIYAKRLNDSGATGYIVIIILTTVLGFLMIAYNNFMRIGAVAVLIGIGGCVLGASILAFSFWAGGFVIMGSIFFMIYEVMK